MWESVEREMWMEMWGVEEKWHGKCEWEYVGAFTIFLSLTLSLGGQILRTPISNINKQQILFPTLSLHGSKLRKRQQGPRFTKEHPFSL